MHSRKYCVSMSPRTGRPRTGVTPNFVRVDPDAANVARAAAMASNMRVGKWIEEAIREKIEREKGERDVTTPNS
jgi:predicted HicB family RNase H-like nuclease